GTAPSCPTSNTSTSWGNSEALRPGSGIRSRPRVRRHVTIRAMDGDFRDRVVIITGGSEGVGAAVARRFAGAGARLVLAARGREKLERFAAELSGTRVLTVPMDVADEAACSELFRTVEREL